MERNKQITIVFRQLLHGISLTTQWRTANPRFEAKWRNKNAKINTLFVVVIIYFLFYAIFK